MKTVIITLLLTAASVMSCKPPMSPTDNESVCISSCKQSQRTADAISEADIIMGNASDDFPSLFIQGNHFQFQRKNGLYAPLGIGFMEVIAEQNPVIALYRTATCKEPEDSIALQQYPFDKDIAERKRKDDNPQEWQDGQNNASCKDGRYYYRYSSESDTLMPLAWRSGSNIHEYLEETASLIYTFPMLRFRVLGLMAGRAEIVLNEESGKTAWINCFPGQIMVHGNRMQRNRSLMRINGIPAKRIHDFDTYYISWEDYLRMVTVVCFKDNTEVRKPFEVQGDTIKSEQGWKLWKQGEELLIKDIIEYYVE